MSELIRILPYALVVFLGNIVYNSCFQKINQIKLNINLKTIVTMIIIAFLICICNEYPNTGIKSVIVSIIMCINFKIIYKQSTKKTVISYIIIYLILIILEITITNILSLTKILVSNDVATDLTYFKIELSIIISMIEYVIFMIPKVNKNLQKLLKIFERNASISNISYLMFLTISILGILNIDNFATTNSMQLIIFLVIIFSIMFTIVIKSKTREEILETTNNKLIEYNVKYSMFLDEYKIYKHNIKHKLIGMKTFGNKKINALIDDLLEEETNFSIKNNNIYNVPEGIRGIVAEKLYNDKINVVINNNIKGDPFIKLKAREFNSISEAIGISLDNAIEASLMTKNPIITMEINEDKENIYIKIGNNFQNSIDIEEIGSKNYSTKKRGSGYGLFSIMRNNIIKESIKIINDFYYIELKIKKTR